VSSFGQPPQKLVDLRLPDIAEREPEFRDPVLGVLEHLHIPLCGFADLRQPVGQGDRLLLGEELRCPQVSERLRLPPSQFIPAALEGSAAPHGLANGVVMPAESG